MSMSTQSVGAGSMNTPSVSTAEERAAIVDAVRDFAAAEIAPHALEWDERKHFPRDVLHRAGELGLGGITVREDAGLAMSSRNLRRSRPTSASTTWWRG